MLVVATYITCTDFDIAKDDLKIHHESYLLVYRLSSTMQLLLSLIWLILAAAAASRGADYAGKITTATIDAANLGTPSNLPETFVPDNQCISSFYHDDAKKDMCGSSTVSNAMFPHCGQGTVSLVDDCNALIQDLQGRNGGGFWGYSNESTIVVASHESCTFSITVNDDKELFNIGTQDVIDLGRLLQNISQYIRLSLTRGQFSSAHQNALRPW